MPQERIDLAERDLRDHARILTEHNTAIKDLGISTSELELDKAIRTVENRNLNDRLDRIEKTMSENNAGINEKFRGIYRLGWWILGAFGMTAISLMVNFIFQGGFHVS